MRAQTKTVLSVCQYFILKLMQVKLHKDCWGNHQELRLSTLLQHRVPVHCYYVDLNQTGPQVHCSLHVLINNRSLRRCEALRPTESCLQIRIPPCCRPGPGWRSSWTAQHRPPARCRPAGNPLGTSPEPPPHLNPSLCAQPYAQSIASTRTQPHTGGWERVMGGIREWE